MLVFDVSYKNFKRGVKDSGEKSRKFPYAIDGQPLTTVLNKHIELLTFTSLAASGIPPRGPFWHRKRTANSTKVVKVN